MLPLSMQTSSSLASVYMFDLMCLKVKARQPPKNGAACVYVFVLMQVRKNTTPQTPPPPDELCLWFFMTLSVILFHACSTLYDPMMNFSKSAGFAADASGWMS